MRAFSIKDYNFEDLGFVGLPFTWDNRKEGVANVKARLDIWFANEDLRQMFYLIKVHHVTLYSRIIA